VLLDGVLSGWFLISSVARWVLDMGGMLVASVEMLRNVDWVLVVSMCNNQLS